MFYIGGENVRDRGRNCSATGRILSDTTKNGGALLPRCKNVLYFLYIVFDFV